MAGNLGTSFPPLCFRHILCRNWGRALGSTRGEVRYVLDL